MQMKKYIKNEKGSMTVYVTATIVSFIIILTAIFYTASSVRKNQLKTILEIKDVYAQYNEKIQEIYDEQVSIRPKQIAKVIKNGVSTENQVVVDEYGNKIVVPAGFIIKEHTGTEISDITYTYTGNNIPAVQDGIVIENVDDGNQFVWIPVGDIKNKDNTTTTITLGRYNNFTIAEDGTLPTPAQAASKTDYDTPIETNGYGNKKHIEISNNFNGATVGETIYEAASSYGNTKAYNLQEWISQALDNGGYYIARYEASKNGEKAASKISTGTPIDTGVTNPVIADGMLWNYITQPNAAIAAKKTYEYSADAKYYSDLINSYAWDTTIIFIEKYSGNPRYANKRGTDINTNLANTGVNNDKVCNIYDMAGNVAEWTTETGKELSNPCTYGGGIYNNSNDRTCGSYSHTTALTSGAVAFRVAIYVK